MERFLSKTLTFLKSTRRYPRTVFHTGNKPGKQIGGFGVCAGIAYQLKIPAFIPRIVFFAAWCVPRPHWFYLGVLMTYLTLWIFVPEGETPDDYEEVCGKLPVRYIYRIPAESVFFGVCAGLAHMTKLNVQYIRLGLVMLLMVNYLLLSWLPLVFFLYFLAFILFPVLLKAPQGDDSGDEGQAS